MNFTYLSETKSHDKDERKDAFGAHSNEKTLSLSFFVCLKPTDQLGFFQEKKEAEKVDDWLV